MSKHSTYSNDEVNNIYKQIPTEYLKYNFLCNLLCTRTHCHLVLNNKELLIEAKPLFEKYTAIFKWLFGYAWLTFTLEEVAKKSKITEQDRIILDLDTAVNLPIYPFSPDDINQNPYACILLDNTLMDLENNCLAMRMIRINPEKYYGVCDTDTFNKRINIFVNGSNKRGIMDKLDWTHFAISGSAMMACGMKYNPLFDLYRANPHGGEISDEEFSTFLFHYYNKSDIDLICNHKSIYDFLDATNTMITLLESEYKTQMKLTQVHTASICMSDEIISSELEELTKILTEEKKSDSEKDLKYTYAITVDYIKRNYSNPKIREYFYKKYYVPWKIEQNERISNPQSQSPHFNKLNQHVYKEYLSTIPCNEFRLYNLDYDVEEDNHNHKDYEKYFYGSNLSFGNTNPKKLVGKISESIRFQIMSKYMNRSWEIFMSRDTSFFSTVYKFHLGFVRAIYNGNTVLCLPSFITAMMIQLSTDYKNFSLIRNPNENINKYRSRGGGLILNYDEKISFAYFNSFKDDEKYELDSDENNIKNSNKWCDMYNVNIKDKVSINAIFGSKDVNDKIFKPSKFFDGITDDCFKTVNQEYYNKASDAFANLYNENTIQLFSLKCINEKGTINPLNRNFIKTGYELINNLNKDKNFNSNKK
jgi:hypothetical protein